MSDDYSKFVKYFLIMYSNEVVPVLLAALHFRSTLPNACSYVKYPESPSQQNSKIGKCALLHIILSEKKIWMDFCVTGAL